MVKITNTNLIKFDNRHGVEAIEGNKIKFWFNGNKYTTDYNGRIISVEAKPTINPENSRNNRFVSN